jgi:3-methylcrotonyl-CoA carboxylase alpha subunit
VKPFESVLIANRGEIAVRIIRTCRGLGVRSIALYSDADARAMHVAEADEAFRIGPPPAAESYLNSAAIIDIARRAHAEALHPGYGFLAENAEFAQACLDAGLVWVGPSPAAMRALGDKAQAKRLAERLGVPLLAGYHGADQDPQTLQREAERIGFPLLIKASAGGGGRGMRIVESSDQIAEALEAAKREAMAAFGDDRVLVERYVERPRHVEVQILADQHGHVVHLGERECSIQRRNQKLIEESPSPAVDARLREQMGAAAIQLATAAGYSNAGTVEFLLDERGGFAFLEVNARLQVEHPVTEALTGLDLVELQLRVAAGEQLPFTQQEVRLNDHAIEARVVAEDALAGWVPSSGRIEAFWFPRSIRCDTWITPGATVSPYYDSLLAKVIACGATRAGAIDRLAEALAIAELEGVEHNLDVLLSTVQHPAFEAGELHAAFLDEHAIVGDVARVPPEVLAAASALDFLVAESASDPWRGPPAWRPGRLEQPAAWMRAGRAHAARVTAELNQSGVLVTVGEATLPVRPLGSAGRAQQRLRVGNRAVDLVQQGSERLVAQFEERSYRLYKPWPLRIEDTLGDHGSAVGPGRLTAPMPGRIVKLAVHKGDHVRPNQPLVVLEAMKMEHVVEAPHAGVIHEVCVQHGQQVTAGTVLVELGDVE